MPRKHLLGLTKHAYSKKLNSTKPNTSRHFREATKDIRHRCIKNLVLQLELKFYHRMWFDTTMLSVKL